jgi:pimeloyl-ACP methyl ester carboxylesterase
MDAFPRVTKRLFRYFLAEADEEAMLEILEDTVKPTASSVRASVRSMMRTDLRPDLPRLRVPALVIHGTRDDIVMPSQIVVIQHALSSAPYLRQRSIEGSRHFPWTDQPDVFHTHLLEFLRAPLATLTPPDPAPVKEATDRPA